MIFELEAFGREVGKVAGALLDFVHPAAGAAVKVVVVSLAGDLVARGLSRHFDLDDPAVGDEGFQGAIDRGHAHPAHASLREIENLTSGNGAVGFGNNRADRIPLPGVSFHLGHGGF